MSTIAPSLGGNDTITTGLDVDIVLGGVLDDLIVTNHGETATARDLADIVLGDNGYLDFTAAERPYAQLLAGDDANPAGVDRIFSTDLNDGGSDVIWTGADDDLVIGGAYGDRIDVGSDSDLVFGDAAALGSPG